MKLKCMFYKLFLVHLGIMIALLTVSPERLVANVTFTTAASAVLLDAQNSKLRISNPAKVIGWGERSIVKLYGNNAAHVWPEAYRAESIIGYSGQPTVTAQAYSNLVDSNSNAIFELNHHDWVPDLNRANSSALQYLHRVNSNAIIQLIQTGSGRIDSSLSTANSNATNLVYGDLVVPPADSVDGTKFFKYCTGHHVFHNGAYTVRGWVRFNDGFTVMPQASVLMDTLTTVSGGFDLRDTGTLILNNDLYLAHNVTLTNGGNIKGRSSSTGQSNTIFMGGDLTLSETTYARTLHITGDWLNSGNSGNLIIDGCGHTLNIGDRAQIFVDTNITLTLRNMTIKTGPKSLNNPAIQLASFGSKLALDNVMFDLGADFHFITGQIFVHNEVAVTGTSAFVYQSPVPSYITSGATWSFEQATTFSVAPSTFTDCPFTVNNTYTNNAFIILADVSAALSLNGCSFQTTFTGLRLTKGMVLFDNKVSIDTQAAVELDSTTPLELAGETAIGTSPYFVACSPDSRFLALVDYYEKTLQVYRFDANSAPSPVGSVVSTSKEPFSVFWSPDGRFLAVAISRFVGSELQVYRFNGNGTPMLVGTAIGVDSGLYSAIWSPDGSFLAVVSDNALAIYRFNGNSAPMLVGTIMTTGNGPSFATWSPDGRFLATANYNVNTLSIYRFDGSNLLTEFGVAPTGGKPNWVAWSPDGRFLLVVNQGVDTIQMYRFSLSGIPVPVGSAIVTGDYPIFAAWSPDGRFFALLNQGDQTIQVYRFNGTGDSVPVGGVVPVSGYWPNSIWWSPDGQSVVVEGINVLSVYRCNYVYSGQPPQGFTNGLLFGDSAKGADYDTNVQVLGGATVSIKGVVYDDAA